MSSSAAAASRLPIWLVLAIILVLHLPASSTSFCGFDDFNENYRAEFEDRATPSRIVTTPHFESFKYRPGNRLLTLLCNLAGGGSAWPFRLRNLMMHLLNVYLVYLLTQRLFGERLAASASALLFGLHHLTHQNVHAAIFTNTFAYALILVGLLCSLEVARSPRWVLLSATAAGSNLLAILSYDPALFAAGLLPLYVIAWRLCTGKLEFPIYRLAIHTAMQGAVVLATFVLRKAFVASSIPEITALPTLLTILFSYATAILIPLDTVSVQYWLDTSITKQLAAQKSLLYLLAAAFAVLGVVLAWMAKRYGWHRQIRPADWAGLLFLAASALLAVLPTSLGSPHLSETYVYFATALSMPVICILAFRLLHAAESAVGKRLFLNTLAVLAVLFGIYDLTRSLMVLDCGNVSQKILASLAADPRVSAGARVLVAKSPYDPPLRHVGVYGYQGLDTIGIGPFAAAALRSALSTTLHRSPVDAEVLSPYELNRVCSGAAGKQPETVCYYVHYEGSVEPWQARPF